MAFENKKLDSKNLDNISITAFRILSILNILLKEPLSEDDINQKIQENIEGAFKAKRNLNLKGKNILLVDDVITTGSTIGECGRVLLNAGANKVYAVSVAIAD